jgi:LPS-assembly protein
MIPKSFLLAAVIAASLSRADGRAQERVRSEIPYKEGTVVLVSDYQERVTRTRYHAQGNVVVTYNDVTITAEAVDYDEETRQGATSGATRFSQGGRWLTCSRAEFDFASQTGVFYEASGFTDQQFIIQGRTIRRTGPETYVVEQGFMTACQDKTPKWSFGMARAGIRVDHTARLHHTTFKIRGIPVLYLPYLIVPLERKERSSGILPFHTGSSTSKGRVVSIGYFQTLGVSADATVYGDYFTRRGLAIGGIFRARPNPQTRLYLLAYGIDDRLGQGGAHLIVDGESHLSNGFRVVAAMNITSNFRFRQAFADTFRSATIPQERSVVFATRNSGSFSTNFSFERDEVLFPGRSLVIRRAPSVELLSLGQPLGNLVLFQLRAAVEGMSRVDASLESPRLVQRLDIFPRLTARLPSIAGFSLVPTAGVRETYYSASIEEEPAPRIVSRSLHRTYSELQLELRTPTFERAYTAWGGFKHVIEPVALVRSIHGIDDLHRTIRFDDNDAIADTDEAEYGIVNRILRSRDAADGRKQQYEMLALRVTQKHYFDPDFGGAFRSGESNIFYPLNTVTGFSLTGIQRALSPTSVSLRVQPAPGMSYDFRTDYDSTLDRMRDASLSAIWQREKLFVAGTYFKTGALETGLQKSNHVQGQAGYGSPNRGFSASLTLSYNVETSKLLNSHSRLNYVWDCCGIAMEFQQFDLGLRTESRFSFSFTLKGIGSFGNLKRPESLF